MNEETKELTYQTPLFSRIFFSSFLDLLLLFLLGSALLFGAHGILKTTPPFQDTIASRETIQKDSKLYVPDEEEVVLLSDYLQSQDITKKEKGVAYEEALDFFYEVFLPRHSIQDGANAYQREKQAYNVNGLSLFDNEGNRLYSNPDYDETYLAFFEDNYQTEALGYLERIPEYSEATRFLLFMELVAAGIAFSLAHAIVYLAIPLSFSRGKKTLGMKLAHLSSVGKNGFSISWKKQLLLWLFQFVLLFWGSILAFLLPLEITLTMQILRKDRQGVDQYVIGVYPVDDQERRIFKNAIEFATMSAKKTKKSLARAYNGYHQLWKYASSI